MKKLLRAIDLLEKVAETRSRKEKEDLLRKGGSNIIFIKMLKLVFGSHTFGMHINIGRTGENTTGNNKWNQFKKLCSSLVNRQLTGNKAISETNNLLKNCSELEQKWYIRILNKDLKIGTSHKTIKKVFPDLLKNINGYNACMLAADWNISTFQQWKSAYVEPKLDGIRATTIIGDKGNATIFTRGGKQIVHLLHISEALDRLKLKNVVLDGELVVYDSKEHTSTNWKKTLSLVKPRKHIGAKMLEEIEASVFYVIFDIIPIKDYINGSCKLPLHTRRKALVKTVKSGNGLEIIKAHKVGTLKGVQAFYKKYLRAGYEGVVIKNGDGTYENKRKNSWLKKKSVIDRTGKIIAFKIGKGKHARMPKKLQEATKKYLSEYGCVVKDKTGYFVNAPRHMEEIKKGLSHGIFSEDPWLFQRILMSDKCVHVRTAPRLGSLIVRNTNTGEKLRVSGMSNALRNEIWDFRDKLLGAYIDYKEQEDYGNTGITRFPVFIRFRDSCDFAVD